MKPDQFFLQFQIDVVAVREESKEETSVNLKENQNNAELGYLTLKIPTITQYTSPGAV